MAVTVSTLTAVYLFIWLALPQYKSFSAVTMKFNTCLSFFFAGISLWLKHKNPATPARVAQAAALVPVLIGTLTFFQYVTGVSFGIDELVVSDLRNAESALYPGRMAPLTASLFILLGSGLVLLDRRSKKGRHLASYCLFPLSFLSAFCLIGYIYGETTFYQFGPYIRISWHSGLCFLNLSFAALLCRPNDGPIRLLTSPTLGGLTMRRMLPFVVFAPIFLGWVGLLGQQRGYYDLQFGTSVLILVLVTLFLALVSFTARRIDKLDRVQQLAEKDLEEALQARDEFLSIASHELKTPLTTLKLQSQLFKRKATKNPELPFDRETIMELVEQTERQANRLTRLVDDMLDISRIRSKKFSIKREKIDLHLVSRELLDRMEPQFLAADLKRPELRVVGLPHGRWDRLRLEQVLTNLLTNAIRYGQGKPIQVEIAATPNQTRFSVTDQGMGIAPENQNKIFDRFERAINASEVSGLGLGLFISKRIVQAHGGRIWVESELEKGSRFVVELPVG